VVDGRNDSPKSVRRISASDKGRRSLLVPSHTGAMAYRDTFRKWLLVKSYDRLKIRLVKFFV